MNQKQILSQRSSSIEVFAQLSPHSPTTAFPIQERNAVGVDPCCYVPSRHSRGLAPDQYADTIPYESTYVASQREKTLFRLWPVKSSWTQVQRDVVSLRFRRRDVQRTRFGKKPQTAPNMSARNVGDHEPTSRADHCLPHELDRNEASISRCGKWTLGQCQSGHPLGSAPG